MRRGFTLLEILMVTAVFSITVVLAVTVFTNTQNKQRTILGKQRVTADGRYVLEDIARAIRTRSIDYTYYRTAGFGNNIIALRDSKNIQTCYRRSTGPNRLETISGSTDCTGTWSTLTVGDLLVDDFRVVIRPQSDPFLPPPAASADCPSGSSYNATSGTCQCASDNQCFADQRCVSTICQNANIQPHVTVTLKTSNNTSIPGDRVQVTLQTTVSSRTYRR